MRRILALFFLFTFLSANTPFGEVIKLPVLIQHYIEHEELQKNISFLDFLKEHYSNTTSHPVFPQHHHDNLPLKTLNEHSITIASCIPTFKIIFEPIFFESDQTTTPLYQEGNFINNYLSQIWQPPRLS